MSVIRAFVAFDLSPEIQHRLDEVEKQLKQRLEGIPVRWVPVDNIHLTLKFLGDVSVSNLEVLKKILQVEARNHPSFEVSIGELGGFPSSRRPRIIWIGVEAPPELNMIQRSIEVETIRLGYAREGHPFSPHLTLGRVSRNAIPQEVNRISTVLGTYKVGFLGIMKVQNVYLYKSDLQPSGAIYTQLLSAPLKLS